MKFVLAAVVVLAVAMGVQSSLIGGVPGLGLGLGVNGLGINGLGLGLGVPGIGLGIGAPGIIGGGWLGAPAAVNIAANPWISAAQIPAAVNIAANPWISAAQIPAAVNIAAGSLGGIAVAKQATLAGPLGATYVAKTRGAIHTAPLAGHIQSVASINGAPAPGTW